MKSRNVVKINIEVVIALLLWCYIIYRAFSISITEDEAYTYLLVKTNNWRQMAGSANTHWLNSLFVRLCLLLPGPDEPWKLRMLSTVSWAVYSLSAIRLSLLFRNSWLGFIFFLTAIGNPFLIFYFSLARGYAAACALIMLALWQAFKLIACDELRPNKWVPVFLFSALAVLSNFSAFYFFLALSLGYLLRLAQRKRLELLLERSAFKWHTVVAATFTFAIGLLTFIRYHKELYYGGKSNMVNSLFGSMVKTFSYFDDVSHFYHAKGVSYLLSDQLSTAYTITGWCIFLLLTIACLYSARSLYATNKLSRGLFAMMLCFFIVMLNVVLHAFFGTPYLLERTALILYPPLVVGTFFMLDIERLRSVRQRAIVFAAYVFFTGLLICNFYKSFSLKSFTDWPVQTNTKECLDYLVTSNAKKVGMSVWQHDVLVNYYLHAYPGKYRFAYETIPEKMNINFTADSLSKFDFILTCPPLYNGKILEKWNLVLNFPESGAKVFKRLP